MRFGTSYFNGTVFAKHLTRFWPIWTFWLAILLLLLPGQGVAILRSGQPGGGEAAYGFAQVQVTELCNGGAMLTLILVMALIAGMAACSHLCTTRSANFMGGLPVRRKGLFVSHYLAGLLMVLGPVVVTGALTALVEQALGALVWEPLLYWVWYTCAAGLFFYSLVVLLGMFTGHLMAIPAFYLVANIICAAMMAVVQWGLTRFYFGFSTLPGWVSQVVDWCTPTAKLAMVYYARSLGRVNNAHTLWIYALVGLALSVCALLLYRRRRLEYAGDVVAVRAMRPVFQYGVALCSGLYVGTAVAQILELSEGGLIAAILLCALAGYFVARMILDKSFRVWKHWRGAVAVAVAFGLLFVVVGFDLTGYETRVPQSQDVASVQVSGMGDWEPRDSGAYISAEVTDPELIPAVTQLHQAVVDQRDGAASPEENHRLVSFHIRYRLRDGSTLSRTYSNVFLDSQGLALEEQLRNDPQVILQSYGIHWVLAGEWRLALIYQDGQLLGGSARAGQLLDAMVEDIYAGRLGRHTPDGMGNGEILTTLELEWEPTQDNGEGVRGSILVLVPDTASSTLAVLEELAGQSME